ADVQSINNNMVVEGSQTWIASGGPLVFNGNTQATFSNDFLTIAGASNTTFNGVLSNGVGALSLTKDDAGTLALGGGGANTYTGATTLSSGTLVLQKNAAGIVAVPGNLFVGDGSGTDRLRILQSEQIGNTATVTVASSGVVELSTFTET